MPWKVRAKRVVKQVPLRLSRPDEPQNKTPAIKVRLRENQRRSRDRQVQPHVSLMLLRGVLGKGRLQDRLRRTAEYCAERGGCFHLWGHSWELDDHNLWPELDEFLACLASLRPCFVTNNVSWSLRLSGGAAAPGTTP